MYTSKKKNGLQTRVYVQKTPDLVQIRHKSMISIYKEVIYVIAPLTK